jgi:hypothetical protein
MDMEAWAKVVGILGLALIVGTTLVLTGPVGKALAEWIRGWSKHDAQWLRASANRQGGRGGDGADAERLAGALEALERRLGEVEERLDFAERLLARERPADRLAPPR